MPDPTTTGASSSPSYDTSLPDVVVDRVTHLMWQRTLDAASYGWDDANLTCRCLTLAGHDDWRLPTRIEMVSIVDFTRADPAIDPSAFPGTPPDYFWTSTVLAGSAATAWYLFFLDGNTHSGGEDSAYRVRCVRGTEPATMPVERYAIAADGTVVDKGTTLTWQRVVDRTPRTWMDQKSYCSNLLLGGGGWRLPNMKELQTLVDESTTGPSIDSVAFPGTPSEAMWTASPLVGGPVEAWFVNFFSGVSYTSVLDHPYLARCVR